MKGIKKPQMYADQRRFIQENRRFGSLHIALGGRLSDEMVENSGLDFSRAIGVHRRLLKDLGCVQLFLNRVCWDRGLMAASFQLRGLGELASVVPAPMSGYGDRAWREVARRMGCQLLTVPIISAEGLARGEAKTRSLIDIEGEPRPIAVQLFGSRPEALAEAARQVEAIGASAVDLNLGCPARRVVRHEGGAALLKHPDLVARLVGAMRRVVAVPLTVKMRAGWDERSPSAVEIARVVEAEGADAVTVHGRTGCQQFQGAADWQPIAEVKAAVRIPVIGNGDVRTGEDAWRMRRETGCDAVMIGRGALGNPWLWRDALAWLVAEGPPDDPLPPPTRQEKLEMLMEHVRLMVLYKGERRGVIEFRKHAAHYLRGVHGSKALRQKLMAFTEIAEIEQAVEKYRRQAMLSGGV